MSFIYPRTIAITRPVPIAAAGDVGYSGASADSETPIASGIPCSIQFKKPSGGLAAHLPADVVAKSMWVVFIPLGAAISLGAVNDRDLVTDDLGKRYQVAADYWNSLGYALVCERLEA